MKFQLTIGNKNLNHSAQNLHIGNYKLFYGVKTNKI